jgi:hypothetical protein
MQEYKCIHILSVQQRTSLANQIFRKRIDEKLPWPTSVKKTELENILPGRIHGKNR